MKTYAPDELHATSWLPVPGRGKIAEITGVPGLFPPDLQNKQVIIDGKLYLVWAVEIYPAPTSRSRSTGKDFGLGVWEV